MALKLDMSKAYDRVEWRFLDVTMRKMGSVDLIMACVESASYQVLVNGVPKTNFENAALLKLFDILQNLEH